MGLDATKPVFVVSDKAYSPQLQRLARKLKFRLLQVLSKSTKNKGADQSVQMRMLVCLFVVCKPKRPVFSRLSPNKLEFIRFSVNKF